MLLRFGGRVPARIILDVFHRYLWRRFSESVFGADVERPVEIAPLSLVVAVVPMTADTVEELLALEPPQIDREMTGARFRRGDHGVVAKVGGRIVSSVWVGGNTWQLRDLGLEVRLAPDQGVLYDAYTAPEARRKGIMASLVRACVEQAKTRGKRALFARGVTTNADTASTLARAGFQEVMTIRGVLITSVLGVYRITGRGNTQPSPEALLSRLFPLRPGFLLWDVGGRRGFKILVPQLWRHPGLRRRYEGTST
jgi:GNAT superfamily N-acetyltransferase